jgi:hypothetical protein
MIKPINNKPTLECKLCGSSNVARVFKYQDLPLYNLNYLNTQEDALKAKKADVDFVLCHDCGFLFNSIYKQLNYKVEYNACRSDSHVFNQYLSNVVKFVISNMDTKRPLNKIYKVVEVGAGDCQFATMLNNSIKNVIYNAYDPSWEMCNVDIKHDNPCHQGGVNKFAEYYCIQNDNPDLVVSRHVLEHQSDVKKFISILCRENPEYIFIEIPCSSFVMKGNWHYYSNEHCSYLDTESLDLLMGKFEYKQVIIEHVFNTENIIAIYKRRVQKKYLTPELSIKNSGIQFEKFKTWRRHTLEKINKNDMIWGAAGKGVMMMNILGMANDKIPFICDKNPDIWGKFIPITANKIISPSELKKIEFGKIIVMNELYLDEIKSEIISMGIDTDVVFIGNL